MSVVWILKKVNLLLRITEYWTKKKAQPGLSHLRDRPYPSDTDSYEIPGLSLDRRLSVQPGYGTDTAAGVTCLEAVLCPSHHRGENAVHSTSAGGYGRDTVS